MKEKINPYQQQHNNKSNNNIDAEKVTTAMVKWSRRIQVMVLSSTLDIRLTQNPTTRSRLVGWTSMQW